MTMRHLAAAALTAGALLTTTAAPASATCYIGQIDICNKPTDPYTDPVYAVVRDVIGNPALDPVLEQVGNVSRTVSEAYADALCLVGDYPYC